MKKFLVLSLLGLMFANGALKGQYEVKNRYVPIAMDESIDGVWGADSDNVADSLYLYQTGLPNYGDLTIPDLELKVKALWYGTKMYFLFRHLDDSLVNGSLNGGTDPSVSQVLEDLDATTLYLFLDFFDTTGARRNLSAEMYEDGSYLEKLAWIRFVWGSDSVEGVIRNGDTVNTLDAFGGEIVQWTDGVFNYAKLSVDMSILDTNYVTPDPIIFQRPLEDDQDSLITDTIPGPNIHIAGSLGFEIQLSENDKEGDLNSEGLFGVQTRAYYWADLDSLPYEPRNLIKWGSMGVSYGSFYCDYCDNTTFLKSVESSDFARIYPNPAREYLFIEFDSYIAAEYKIVDIMGRIVKNGSANGYDSIIQVSDLRAGTYFVNILNAKGEMMTKKLLINK